MKRLLFPAFLSLTPVLAASLVLVAALVAACDPDLGVVTTQGGGGTEASVAEGSAPLPTTEAGTTDGGPDEGGTEAGPTEHKVDGTNDFTAGEKLATTSAGYDAYVSWDDKKVYFGMSGADMGSGSSSKWVVVYVDGVPGNAGSPTGLSYDCSGSCTARAQQAHLPFNAGFLLQWQTGNGYTNLQKWSGTAWTPVGPISSYAQKGTFFEASLLRSVLGSPTKLKVHMAMVVESATDGWTYAGVPSTSFTDGFTNAPFTKYYEFDLADTAKAPNTYAPK